MQDRVPLYPGRVTLTPVSGQANTYDLTRADQPTQEGTPLNKASLLNDATAALYGLPNTAVPDDVLSKIKTLIDSANANANTKARIATGSYTGTGTYGASHPNSLTFAFEPAVLLVSSPGNYGLEGFGYDSSSNVTYAMIGSVLTTSYKQYFGIGVNANATGYGKKSSDGKTFFWYNTASAANQWNESKKVYHYIAIG